MTKIPNTMRPGVFSRVEIHPISTGNTAGGAAVVAAAASGEAGKAVPISALSQAEVFGTESTLYGMVKILLEAGVSPLHAVSAQDGYPAAFAALEGIPQLAVVISDGGQEQLAAYITASCDAALERVGILAVPAVDAACEAAGLLNHAHVVVACGGGTKNPLVAAAFGAAVALSGAQDSLNGAVLPLDEEEFEGAFTPAELETLLRGGVTPFEKSGGQVECVRAVTSSTRRGETPDRTLSGLSTVLAVDDVTSTVRRALKLRMGGMKNNPVTRESIASQIMVELENKRMLGIIDSYQPPVVAPHPQDAGICVATLAIKIAPEISQIVISAEIQV